MGEVDKEYIQIIDADKFSDWYSEKIKELENILRSSNISYDTGRKITEVFDKFNLYGDDEICLITEEVENNGKKYYSTIKKIKDMLTSPLGCQPQDILYKINEVL